MKSALGLRSTRVFVAPLLMVVAALIPPQIQAADLPPEVTSRTGMVVAVSPPAAEVGAEVLKHGGNAVDAAVATALAMAVTYPPAGNIGGGGFMMILPGPGQEPVCIDYREKAPAAATTNMFALGESSYGHKIVGVPGTVRGLALAHAKYGRAPWKQLVMPAVKLAEQGFAVDAPLAASLNGLLQSPDSRPFAEHLRVFASPNGRAWREGDMLVQAELGWTMRQIAEGGADGFYRGPVAEKLVDEMETGNGLITFEDLENYQAVIRTPISTTFRGHTVFGPPPPSSGGIALVEMLNILETFDLRGRGRWSADTMHLMVEAMRRAYLDRARYLGDADFVTIPEKLTTKAYAAELARGISLEKATSSVELAEDIPLTGEGTSTTHFSVIDAEGMAVSNTYTLEHSYGSRVVVRGAGFLLNNEMGDFNWKPGHTDRTGRIGTPANVIQPGKRMLSSQTPVLVTKDGRAALVTGSPGGRTIINTSLCVVLNMLEFEMHLPEAVAAPRLHHQWLPDVVRFEAADEPQYRPLADDLRQRGHDVDPRGRRQGDAHSIWIDDAGLRHGVADPRILGKAVTY